MILGVNVVKCSVGGETRLFSKGEVMVKITLNEFSYWKAVELISNKMSILDRNPIIDVLGWAEVSWDHSTDPRLRSSYLHLECSEWMEVVHALNVETVRYAKETNFGMPQIPIPDTHESNHWEVVFLSGVLVGVILAILVIII